MNEFVMKTADYQRRYNCSFYEVGTIPVALRRNVGVGLFFVTIGTIEEASLKS
jgi:hypothetical protein